MAGELTRCPAAWLPATWLLPFRSRSGPRRCCPRYKRPIISTTSRAAGQVRRVLDLLYARRTACGLVVGGRMQQREAAMCHVCGGFGTNARRVHTFRRRCAEQRPALCPLHLTWHVCACRRPVPGVPRPLAGAGAQQERPRQHAADLERQGAAQPAASAVRNTPVGVAVMIARPAASGAVIKSLLSSQACCASCGDSPI